MLMPAPLDDDPFARASAEFPCTVAQRMHWTLDKANPGDPTLNLAARWRLEGQVTALVLEQSLQRIVDRHETLRTAFIERDGVPVQIVMAAARFALRSVDLSGLAASERTEAMTRQAREAACTPFDLGRPPLLRATLVRLEPAVSELLVTTHHLVGDCWSNGILAQETADIYDALKQGRVPHLPALEMQFGDYACWQQAWLEQGGADDAEAYWHRQLANLPGFHVPTDREPPTRPAGTGDIVGMPVPKELAEAAQALARAQGVTFFMLGVATMATVLHRWTGAAEVVFGTQIAGRDELELEGVVGPFVNTVALRITVAAAPSFMSLLDDVREIVGDALEHGVAPIERVVRRLDRVSPSTSRRDTLTAINFLVPRAATRGAADGEFVLEDVPDASPGSRHDLNLCLVEGPDGWRACCEFDPELFDRPRIDWLLCSFLRVLELVSNDPGCRPADMALVDDFCSQDQPASTSAASGPPGDMERQLAGLWTKVLHQETMPRNANFFSLGGDSIRAAQLLALTRQTLGRSISLGQLFRAPTLAAMAALLRDDVQTAAADVMPTSEIVWVQPHGSKPPIFAINNTGIFHTLAHHLGNDQPFAAIQALDPQVSPSLLPSDFRMIAARYVEVIRRVRPHGPYALIGLCAAGKVAFEAARQLGAAGEEVRLLAVVDSWAPGHFRRMTARQRLRARLSLRTMRLGRQLQRIRQGTLSLRGFLANRAILRGVRNAAFELLRRTGRRDTVPPGVQNNLFVNYLDNASRRYVPRPIAGSMLVFHGPEQPHGGALDPSYGWSELAAGRIDVIAVPADQGTAFVDHHQGLFQDPGARVMADAIAAILAPRRLLHAMLPPAPLEVVAGTRQQ